jgi:hypothetical protein
VPRNSDTLTEHPIGILESQGDLGGRTFRLGRIRHAPVRRHRLAGPHWTRFTRRVVANGKNEIVIAEALQELDRVRHIDRE